MQTLQLVGDIWSLLQPERSVAIEAKIELMEEQDTWVEIFVAYVAWEASIEFVELEAWYQLEEEEVALQWSR